MRWEIYFLSLFSCFYHCTATEKNLYDFKNCPVQELDHESYHHILDKQKMTMIVFYAPWCGHCQHFAPEYVKAAKLLQDQYKNLVKFGAVNCVTQRKICQDNGVKSYPTLRSFGFGKERDNEFKKADGHSISSMSKFLEKYSDLIFAKPPKGLKGSYKDRDSVNLNISSVPMPVIEQSDEDNLRWRQRAMNALARTTSSVDRLHDALVSLRFLIEVDVMAQSLDDELKRTITSFFEYLLPLLPQEPRRMFRQYYDGIRAAGLLSQQKRHLDSLTVSDTVAKKAFGNSLRNWRVCGVVPSVTSTSHSSTKLLENEGNQELFDSSRTGYPCGLWMLFHYLTVASQHYSIEGDGDPNLPLINAHDIMSFIRLTVEQLFNCWTCRQHFLHMYDRCLYGRCDISPSDYRQLQIWLWSAHNDATLRILNYHLPLELQQSLNNSQGVNNDLIKLQSNLRWPGTGQCDHCFKEKQDLVTSESVQWSDVVVEYLQRSYWDPSWKIEIPPSFSAEVSTNQAIRSNLRPSSSIIPPVTNSDLSLEDISSSQASPLSIVLFFFLIFLYAITYKRGVLSTCLRKRSN